MFTLDNSKIKAEEDYAVLEEVCLLQDFHLSHSTGRGTEQGKQVFCKGNTEREHAHPRLLTVSEHRLRNSHDRYEHTEFTDIKSLKHRAVKRQLCVSVLSGHFGIRC